MGCVVRNVYWILPVFFFSRLLGFGSMILGRLKRVIGGVLGEVLCWNKDYLHVFTCFPEKRFTPAGVLVGYTEHMDYRQGMCHHFPNYKKTKKMLSACNVGTTMFGAREMEVFVQCRCVRQKQHKQDCTLSCPSCTCHVDQQHARFHTMYAHSVISH